ncbi:2Fe-2S iron-sulfur cluster binding domain-containing protein [Nannocystis punicea]|uniref:2Fe-2S iron-sulfur cluster binding domain-containing protein n=1 Tax=Nannocystis punicea TaxID=2995304 RepID=UPI003531251B
MGSNPVPATQEGPVRKNGPFVFLRLDAAERDAATKRRGLAQRSRQLAPRGAARSRARGREIRSARAARLGHTRSGVAIEFLTAARQIVLDVADIVADDDELPPTLLDAIRAARLPIGQSCRGEGVCRSCAVDVELGLAALPRPTPLEARFGFTGSRRLACQVALPAAQELVRLHHPAWGRPPASSGGSTSAPSSGPGGAADDRLEP